MYQDSFLTKISEARDQERKPEKDALGSFFRTIIDPMDFETYGVMKKVTINMIIWVK